MPWTYKISTGEMFSPNMVFVAKGYAGMGIDKNDPTKENVPYMGPLPEGEYNIGPAIDHTKLGPIALPLKPLSFVGPAGSDFMYKRGGFFIHADSLDHPGQASEGCIVLPTVARMMINENADKTLKVVA